MSDLEHSTRINRRQFLSGLAGLAVGGSYLERADARAQCGAAEDYVRSMIAHARAMKGWDYALQYWGDDKEMLAAQGKPSIDCSELIQTVINQTDREFGIRLDRAGDEIPYGTYNQMKVDFAPKLDVPPGTYCVDITQYKPKRGDVLYVTDPTVPDPTTGIAPSYWGEHVLLVTGHNSQGELKVIEATADPTGRGDERGQVVEHVFPMEKYGKYQIQQIRRVLDRVKELEPQLTPPGDGTCRSR